MDTSSGHPPLDSVVERGDEPRPIATQAGSESSQWLIGGDLWAYVAEGVVAHLLYSDDPNTRWLGGHHTQVDVFSGITEFNHKGAPILESAKMKVDVKRAFIQPATRDRKRELMLGFMGSGRSSEAREKVTHYGLVVFHEPDANAESRLSVDLPMASIRAEYQVKHVYLVPQRTVNELFLRGENIKGIPSGLNLYARLRDLDEWLKFPAPDRHPPRC